MNKEQKKEVIETLKNKFSQYSNFYITDTQNLSVAQITNLRRHCFDKQVEMKVAKNTLIKKALESLDNDKYSGVYDSLHQVTALLFSDSPKEPALIISSFRKSLNGEKPLLKAAFLNGDIFVGDNQLISLTKIKTKNELIGEVIGLLMSPIQRVIGALQNRFEAAGVTENKAEGTEATVEIPEPKVNKTEAKSDTRAGTESKAEGIKPATEVSKPEAKAKVDEPIAKAPEATPETEAVPGTKAEVIEPASEVAKPEAKVKVDEPTDAAPGVKSGTTEVPETKAEAIEPASEAGKPEAKTEVAGPKAVTTEAKSGTVEVPETKAVVNEPASEKVKPETKAEGTESAPDTSKSKAPGSETQPEV